MTLLLGLGGKDCSAFWNYDDRVLYVPSNDVVLAPVYFAHCGLIRSSKVDVTFYVELSQGVYNTVGGQQAISPHDVHEQGVYLAGGGTFGVPGDNLMSDPSGNNVFEITMQLERGSTHQFAFILGDDAQDWSGKEDLHGHGCSSGEWNDRQITIGETNMIVGPFCFGQCCTCAHKDAGTTVAATFSVDMNGMTIAADGVFLAGGAFFGPMQDEYKMADDDGDGVYEITVDVPAESHQHYAFTNGRCLPNWDCKEDLKHSTDLACTRPENYNDREIIFIADDVAVPTVCFGGCGPCDASSSAGGNRNRRADGEVAVTFRLNTDFSVIPKADQNKLRIDRRIINTAVWSVAGGGVFGVPGDNTMKLRPGSPAVYEWTTWLAPGAYKFAFVNSDGADDWNAKEQLNGGAAANCVDQDKGSNEWSDRDLVVPDDGSIKMEFTYCFGQCGAACTNPPKKEEIKVKFQLDMALVNTVSAGGVFLAGGGVFGNPGDNAMTPRKVCTKGEACHTFYEIDVMLAPGEYYYSFTNGLGSEWNPWETKEDLEGQDCVANQWCVGRDASVAMRRSN